MDDSNSTMPPTRQLRYEKQCRQNWKENAAKKQEKLRSYLQLTRALKRSRDSWKAKAKEAQQQVKELEKQLAIASSSAKTENSARSSTARTEFSPPSEDSISPNTQTNSTQVQTPTQNPNHELKNALFILINSMTLLISKLEQGISPKKNRSPCTVPRLGDCVLLTFGTYLVLKQIFGICQLPRYITDRLSIVGQIKDTDTTAFCEV
ncbi:hypothetical protein [Gloeothece verrucosa]|uniref:Uncharacterized protein n=1 Tax=Gloeothece verrucosa (strain PCC 7822) TaxID=497965 RepID=E0UMW8_GLOV7|nr:hypothetical protein [Gloeothece verrucosa]ADN18298.1 hypothetical protein Cyan7822_6529 [Gloeothece verrucosa PCC 7822]